MMQARVLTSQELKRVLTLAAAGRPGQRNCVALLLSHYAGLRVVKLLHFDYCLGLFSGNKPLSVEYLPT